MKKIRFWRQLVVGLVFVIVGLGLVFNTGLGTLSSLGYQTVASICPLGALESIFGSWFIVPRLIIGLLAVVVFGLMFGKAFCAWLCPVSYIRKWFLPKKKIEADAFERDKSALAAYEKWKAGECGAKRKFSLDTRYAVLGAALITTAVFGFPVFCLVCPIGLSFATFVTLWRCIQFNELTWGLIVFPLIVIVELLLFRRWCMKVCPVGALFSLLGNLNKTFRPKANAEACLRANGSACHACSSVCPELIDPYANLGERPMSECIKCGRCAEACPAECISFPFIDRKKK